jgi:hypothetical protein
MLMLNVGIGMEEVYRYVLESARSSFPNILAPLGDPMRHACLLVALMSAIVLTGCDDLQQQAKPQVKQEPPPKVAHHFDPIARSEGNLAVDTATGQMCKTWEWACSKPTYYNPRTKQVEDTYDYGISCASIDSMPTCKSLSEQ